MRPTLFSLELGGRSFGLHAYGLFVALGLGLGIYLAVRQATRQGFSRPRFLDLSFWAVVVGVAVSRALYVLLNLHGFVLACRGSQAATATDLGFIPRTFSEVLNDCTYALRFWEGGLVFYGGVIGAAGVLIYFSRKHGWRLGQLADLFTPGLALGHALGRLGCFSAGCCFGKPSTAHFPWALTFPVESVAFHDLAGRDLVDLTTGRTVALHPTQLYESVAEALIFVVLLVARRAWARQVAKDSSGGGRPGQLFALYLLLYAPLRFVLEIFRGDAERKFLWPVELPRLARALGLPSGEPLVFSTSQTVSVLILLAVVAWWWRGRRSRSAA